APRLLLLDEPYSNLDIIHKTVLKTVIDEVADQLGTTCLLVSHEPLDSLSWAEELMVLREGAVVQQAGPEEIYRQPLDEYVAALFGKFNILSPALAKAFSAFTDIEMNRINSFIRPEDFKIVPDEGAGLRAQVTRTVFMGSYHEAELLVAGHRVTVNTGTAALTRGGVAYLSL
ncbi:MAG: TOBE domain-containing protein, partial [Flavisolibacter sp.]